jgi:hypothetical protein
MAKRKKKEIKGSSCQESKIAPIGYYIVDYADAL